MSLNFDSFIKGANRVCLEPLHLMDAFLPIAEMNAIPLYFHKNRSPSELATSGNDHYAREAIRTVECWLLENKVDEYLESIFSHTEEFYPLVTASAIYLLINTEIVANWIYNAVIESVVRTHDRIGYQENRANGKDHPIESGQEVMTKLLENIKLNYFFIRQVKWVNNKIEPVLRQIAENLIIDYLRRETLWNKRHRIEGDQKAEDNLDDP